MNTEKQITSLLKVLSQDIYEKEHILAMALLSAIAGESIFLLGPPGTAKSLVARRLKLAFENSQAFEYLMSRFSTPDELFGPVSISLLKNEDRYERVVDGFLPTATVVFLDEIWKASPSIQNALLTVINERIFQNGRITLQVPMKVLIAASNELPAEDEGLEALWDRFIIRMVSNCIQSEMAFYKMIRQKAQTEIVVPKEYLISDDMYIKWQADIDKIDIPDEVCKAITFIRKRFREEMKKDEAKAMNYYISDRRWKKCFRLMQTAAFLNGREAVGMTEIPILFHCLWNKVDTIPTVVDIVGQSLTVAFDSKVEKMEKEIGEALQKGIPAESEKEDANVESTFLVYNYCYYALNNYAGGNCLFFKTDWNHVDTKKPTDGILYWDDEKRAWIVHAIFTGAPFDNKPKTASQVSRVKLTKFRNGIIIDGTPYAFKQNLSAPMPQNLIFDSEPTVTPSIAEVSVGILTEQFLPQCQHLKELFSKTSSPFLSGDDKKVAKKYLDKCETRLNEALAKAKNAALVL